jgi:hypothetical protein
LREGSSASLEALSKPQLCAKHSRGKTSKRERTLQQPKKKLHERQFIDFALECIQLLKIAA